MPCSHKFFGHYAHMEAENGLLPNWDSKTLIIGTFNPTNEWVPNNAANYYYGRSRYFWSILPTFACLDGIDKRNSHQQIAFLENQQIALTDLLISINDADINVPDHVRRIRSFKDN